MRDIVVTFKSKQITQGNRTNSYAFFVRKGHSIWSIPLILNYVFVSSFSSSGFQLSPDFRQRASSNASSVGRLSPIPSVVDLEPSWSYASLTQDFDSTPNSIRCNNMNQGDSVCMNQNNALDQLAGSLADDLTLQNEFLQGWVAATFILFIGFQCHWPGDGDSGTVCNIISILNQVLHVYIFVYDSQIQCHSKCSKSAAATTLSTAVVFDECDDTNTDVRYTTTIAVSTASNTAMYLCTKSHRGKCA